MDRKNRYIMSMRSNFSRCNSGKRSNSARKKATPHEQCVHKLKIILQCYNVLILILGCGMLGIGVWLLVKEFNTREMSAIMGTRVVEIISYGLIAGGVVATLLAFCGCCGTMKQEKFVLGFYGGVLTVVLVTLCVGFAVSFIFRGDVSTTEYLTDLSNSIVCASDSDYKDNITWTETVDATRVRFTNSRQCLLNKLIAEDVKKRFKTTIIYNYGVETQKNATNKLITDAWDSMQQALECCGAHGDVNDVYSWGIYKQQSQWYKLLKRTGSKTYVPDSCCVEDKNRTICQGNNDNYDGPPVFGPPNSEHRTHKGNDNLHTTGCYDKALVYLDQHFVIISVVTGSAPILLLVGSIIAFYLCANINETADEFEEREYEVEL